MATSEQILALINAYYKRDDEQVKTLALQIAAHEAKIGHSILAQSIKDVVMKGSAGSTINRVKPIDSSLIINKTTKSRKSDLIVSPKLGKQIEHIILEFAQRAKLSKNGYNHRRKILLEGLPGTGKTLTASVLATELKLPLFIVQTDTVFSNPTVAVCILDTGVNKNHILIDPYMPTNAMTAESQWGVADNNGHGTNMAGIALYNDLKEQLISNQSIQVNHLIESVKVYEPNSPTSPNLYVVITQTATLLPEIAAPDTKRIYCMAVTDPTSASNDGQPSSWSGAIDNLAFENNKRLYILSAGNTDITDLQNDGYPDACLNKSVEDPAQSWNALTVGAYTIDTEILPNAQTRGYTPVAQQGELSPYSSTCETWKKQWPIKPEVVCDGGNVATDGTNYLDGLDELSKLTLNKDISKRLFDTIWATSAATAQCSYIAAELMATYPDMHPETLRALIVHSARWTNAMKNQFGYPDTKTQGRKKLLRTCGYGVPDLARARDTLNNCVNMIIEDELQPYEKNSTGSPKMNEMHLHEIPWPQEILSSLENAEVKVRITLASSKKDKRRDNGFPMSRLFLVRS